MAFASVFGMASHRIAFLACYESYLHCMVGFGFDDHVQRFRYPLCLLDIAYCKGAFARSLEKEIDRSAFQRHSAMLSKCVTRFPIEKQNKAIRKRHE